MFAGLRGGVLLPFDRLVLPFSIGCAYLADPRVAFKAVEPGDVYMYDNASAKNSERNNIGALSSCDGPGSESSLQKRSVFRVVVRCQELFKTKKNKRRSSVYWYKWDGKT